MPAYFLTNTLSDVASTNLMNALSIFNNTTRVISLANSQTLTFDYITPIPYPNNNNVTTTTATLVLTHTVVPNNVTVTAQLHRVNSAGVIQSSGTEFTPAPTVGATNTISNLDEPTWSNVCTDRIMLRLKYINGAMATRSVTLGTNRSGTYLLSSIPHNTGCTVLRKPSWVVSGRKFTPRSASQVTQFNSAYFSFGTTDASNIDLTQFNRTISFSTDVESTRIAMSTVGRVSQAAGGFSSTDIYHVNGFDGGLNTTKNKVTFATDTQSSPTISFTVERRGATCNLPHFTNSRIYFMGGYSDNLNQYRSDTTYISTATDTATNSTAITAARHVSVGMYDYHVAYILGGYTTGDVATNTIYKYIMTTDTASNTSLTETQTNVQGYSFSNKINGYRLNGATVTNTANVKIAYATETKSTSSNGPETISAYQGVSSTTDSTGYLWTGYRSNLERRLYHKMLYSTETWTNSSYTTTDTTTGWIQGTSGA